MQGASPPRIPRDAQVVQDLLQVQADLDADLTPVPEDSSIVVVRPAASSGDEGAVTTVDLAKIERYLAGKDELSGPGVPSFLTGPASADRKAGAVFWTLAVRDPGGSLAGAFSLGVRSDPDPGLKQRVLTLLRDARPAVANGLAVRSIRELVLVPEDMTGYNQVIPPITDPSPFNHSTKIAVLDVRRK